MAKTRDMTVGSPTKLIFGFFMPLLFGLLFQQMYNAVDTVVVGRFLGVNALAGVGATGALNFLILGFCTGTCTGFAIPVAQKFGEHDFAGLKRYAVNAIMISVAFSLVVGLLVSCLCRTFLVWMNTPADIIDDAFAYLFVIFLGIPVVMLYNVLFGIIRSMGADQAAEIKKEAELAQIKAAEEVAIRQNQLDLKQADLKKQADKAKAEADMVKATVTAEKQRELYIAQQEAEIAAETKKVELAERQADVRERELNATVKKQAEADRYAAEQAAEADLYKRTKQAEAARIERQNQSDAELYSAQKDAEGIQARAKAEAEATRLKGESEGAAEKAHGEGVAAGIKAQAEAYNGMDNPYLLANRYIDIMPKVAEQVAKPLTAVDSIKMYGSGNAQKLVKETTSIVDQVASGLKDSTGIDLPSLLNGLISNPDIDVDSAENSVE